MIFLFGIDKKAKHMEKNDRRKACIQQSMFLLYKKAILCDKFVIYPSGG